MNASVLITGLLFSLSLIVAIGAQNAYVLQQGALRRHVSTVVAICAISDVVLIGAGVVGVGQLVGHGGSALTVARLVGAALLLGYGLLAALRAWRGDAAALASEAESGSRARVAWTTFAFTWLNPAVYLDTLLLLGSVANAHPHTRWSFALGAALASVGWFIALGWGSRLLTPLMRHPLAPRCLDAFVAVVMVITALRTLPL